MGSWHETIQRVEALQDVPLDRELIEDMERHWRQAGASARPINFYTPTFKAFQTSEISSCGRNAWPAVSITGGDCKLQCDHCKAKILEPMIPARSPRRSGAK